MIPVEGSTPPTGEDRPKVRILIVEDERITALDIKKKLERFGYEVPGSVSTGKDAVAKVAELHPDLVLMDIVLKGGMDGVMAADEIRTRYKVPVVYLTAFSDPATLDRAKITEPFGYLLKPIEERDLLTTLEMALFKHQMQKKLEDSERWLAATLVSISDGVIATDATGKVRFLNPQAEALTGWCLEEAAGKLLENVLCFSNNGHGAQHADELLQSTDLMGQTCRSHLISRQGTKIQVEFSASPLQDEHNVVSGVVVVFRDITERCQMEQDLKTERHLLHTLLDHVPSHIYFKDCQSRFLRLSQSLTRHFNLLEPSQAIGKTDFDFFSEVHAGQAFADEQEIIRTGNPLIDKIEEETHPDGRMDWVSTSKMPFRDPVGQIIGTFGISKDVTKQKKAEEALQKAHEGIEQLVSSIPSILIGIDSETKIIQWNLAAAETFGFPATEVLGLRLDQLPIQWDVSSLMEGISRAIESPRPMNLDDIRYKLQDGRDGILGFTLRSFAQTKGGQSGCLLIGADITNRRVLEAQLRQAQKLESIGQLAAGIAHEINTPTQFVGDNIRFLQEAFEDLKRVGEKFNYLLQALREGKFSLGILAEIDAVVQGADLEYLSEEVPRAIQQSLDGIARVTKIVRSMKDFAHPDLAEKTMADLNKAIESTITVARNEWKYVAEMALDLDPSLPLVPCVLGDFNQVILNMIINAAHAIGEKVRDTGVKGTITVQTRQAKDWAEIRISDTGMGIEEQHRSRIFDPFFTTKEVGKGTGQGLTISHAVIVEKHKGAISFETEWGKGTTFIICLPLEEKPVAPPESLPSKVEEVEYAKNPVC